MIKSINSATLSSLYIENFYNESRLNTGTGFLTIINGQYYLLTNRHNVTGRTQGSNKSLHPSGGIPNKIKIYHHARDGVAVKWIPKIENLYSDMESFDMDILDSFLWIEHPTLKEKADLIALRLTDVDGILGFCYDIENTNLKISLNPSESVSIIGFPFGKNAGEHKEQFLPIWINGFLASEIDFDVDGLPIFYVDARSRGGQSGSPVIAYRNGVIKTRFNSIETLDCYSELLGIYSGRINEQSDIGIVWKLSALKEIVEHIKGK